MAQLAANHPSNIHIGGFVNGFVNFLAICDKATEEHSARPGILDVSFLDNDAQPNDNEKRRQPFNILRSVRNSVK